MKKYQSERAIAQNQIHTDSNRVDITRTHAVNWGIGVMILSFVGYVFGWCLLKIFWVKLPAWTIGLCLPLSLLIGPGYGALKLISFTEEYRDWLYATEDSTQTDMNNDGVIGQPDPDDPSIPLNGTMIMGIDGLYHRIDSKLNIEEVQKVKRLLLLSQKATVRSLSDIVGERASHLRNELISLGICHKPEYEKAAALLSEPGMRVVKRW